MRERVEREEAKKNKESIKRKFVYNVSSFSVRFSRQSSVVSIWLSSARTAHSIQSTAFWRPHLFN